MNLLNINERLVISMIGSFMGNKMIAWPSNMELARVCGISIKTLQRTIKKLEEKNIIFVERKHRQNNVYTFNANWLAIFDSLGVKLGKLGRQSVLLERQSVQSRASNCRTNNINNNINNNYSYPQPKKWDGLYPTSESASNLLEDYMNKMR